MSLRFAGRFAVRTAQPVALSKSGCAVRLADPAPSGGGATAKPAGDRTELMAGLACSECVSGPRLARVLAPATRLQQDAVAAMERGDEAPVLSLHTSAAVSPWLDAFAEALEASLPHSWTAGVNSSGSGGRSTGSNGSSSSGGPATSTQSPDASDDWFFNLQIEGASAVSAAVDGLLQLQRVRGHAGRTGVAVASRSYHGPPSTSHGSPPGPWGARANQLPPYPAPTVWARPDGESEGELEGRVRGEFASWLDEHAERCGVMLVEPQWGSSSAAMPWPPGLLRWCVAAAQERGVLVAADEVMCGLHRHGLGGMLATGALGIDADAVTVGKALGAGVYPVAAAVFRKGVSELASAGLGVLQSHTYAGASSLALATAAAVLRELPSLDKHVAKCGEAVATELAEPLTRRHGGVVRSTQGQGLLWGVALRDEVGSRGFDVFKQECASAGVRPYFVGNHSFLVSPPLDVDASVLSHACSRLVAAVGATEARLRPRLFDAHHGAPAGKTTGGCMAATAVAAEPTPVTTSGKSAAGGDDRAEGPPPAVAAQGRLPPLGRDDLASDEQRELYDTIVESRVGVVGKDALVDEHGGLRGPWNAEVTSPLLGRHLERLGSAVRHDNALPARVYETAILAVGAHWRSQFEWFTHEGMASRAGVAWAALPLIKASAPAEALAGVLEPDEHAAYAVATELLATKRVSDATYASARAALGGGDREVVDLCLTIGCYSAVCAVLNTFEVPLPAGETPPFAE